MRLQRNTPLFFLRCQGPYDSQAFPHLPRCCYHASCHRALPHRVLVRETQRPQLDPGHLRQELGSKVPECPECRSREAYKDGVRYTHSGEVQRYSCRNCGYRFSDTERSQRTERLQRIHTLIISSGADKPAFCRVGASSSGAKNLVISETRIQEQAAGATQTNADTKSKLLEFAWWMKKQGYADQTILGRTQLIKILTDRGANLLDPESIKEVIAKQKNWCEGRKANAVISYSTYLRMHGGKWDPPHYQEEKQLPWIPQEKEIDDLIAGCSMKIGCFLQVMKEGAIRPGEAWRLKWTDIDFQNRTITLNRPEKHSRSRQFRISANLATVLSSLQRTRDAHPERIFNYVSTPSIRRCFEQQRKRIAYKTGNPRLLKISFKTLRHWKATMEYHRTKDILYVMNFLGHKRIENTLKYTHLVDVEEDEYVSRVAKTTAEVCTLVDGGFEYVCDVEGDKIFRKRK